MDTEYTIYGFPYQIYTSTSSFILIYNKYIPRIYHVWISIPIMYHLWIYIPIIYHEWIYIQNNTMFGYRIYHVWISIPNIYFYYLVYPYLIPGILIYNKYIPRIYYVWISIPNTYLDYNCSYVFYPYSIPGIVHPVYTFLSRVIIFIYLVYFLS